jgi:CBS domain-containing protein
MIANTKKAKVVHRPARVATAADLMTRNPLSVNEAATLRDAALFLTTKDISAAPVINEAGRPVGVISLADIVRSVHASEVSDTLLPLTVREAMTPVVFFVRPDTPVGSVVRDLLDCSVHRLFVVDDNEVLIGVISTLDLLRSWDEAPTGAPGRPGVGTRSHPRRALRRRLKRSAGAPSGSDIVMAATAR